MNMMPRLARVVKSRVAVGRGGDAGWAHNGQCELAPRAAL